MNNAHRNPDVEQLLADAGREWRATLPPSEDQYQKLERRAARSSVLGSGRMLASLGGVLALAAVAVLIVVSLPAPNQQVSAASPTPPASPSRSPSAIPVRDLTPAEAIERVLTFVGVPAPRDYPGLTADLVANGPTEGPGGRFYEVVNAHLLASVDAATGEVVSVLFLGSDTPSGEGPTADEAVAIAETYLTEHGIPFAGMTRTIERKDHGETWEWSVKWVMLAGDVILPDLLIVVVDPSGHVGNFVSYRRPYSSPPAPKIDRTTAEAAAIQTAFPGASRTQLESTTLRLKVDSDGNQRLVWDIEVSAWLPGQPPDQQPMDHAAVEVDALSGLATVIARG